MMNEYIEKMEDKIDEMDDRYDVLQARYYVCDQRLRSLGRKPDPGTPDTPYDRSADIDSNCEKMDMTIVIARYTIPDMVFNMDQMAKAMREKMIDGDGDITRESVGDEDLAQVMEECAARLAEAAGAACERMIDRYEKEIDTLAKCLKEGR